MLTVPALNRECGLDKVGERASGKLEQNFSTQDWFDFLAVFERVAAVLKRADDVLGPDVYEWAGHVTACPEVSPASKEGQAFVRIGHHPQVCVPPATRARTRGWGHVSEEVLSVARAEPASWVFALFEFGGKELLELRVLRLRKGGL